PPHMRQRIRNALIRLLSSPHVRQLASAHMKVAFAESTSHGMSTAIPSSLLAGERTDGHARPVRAQKGGGKRKGKKEKGSTAPRPADLEAPLSQSVWTLSDPNAGEWEEFQ